MQWLWLAGGVAALGIGVMLVWQWTDLGRTVQTLYLIQRVSPYEQSGTGAGHILLLSDSTGYGTGAASAGETVAGRLGAEFPSYQITNWSVNGDTIADALARARELRGQYDLVLLQLGGNDILQRRALDAVAADMQELLALVQPHTESVVMISAGNVGAAPRFSGATARDYTERTRAFHARLEAIATPTPNFTYVSLYEPPEADPFVQDPATHIAADGLHPSGAGYGVWYAQLAPTLRERLNPVTD